MLCQCGVYGAQPQGFRNLKGLGSCGPRRDARCIAHSEILVSAAQVGGLTRGLGTGGLRGLGYNGLARGLSTQAKACHERRSNYAPCYK